MESRNGKFYVQKRFLWVFWIVIPKYGFDFVKEHRSLDEAIATVKGFKPKPKKIVWEGE